MPGVTIACILLGSFYLHSVISSTFIDKCFLSVHLYKVSLRSSANQQLGKYRQRQLIPNKYPNQEIYECCKQQTPHTDIMLYRATSLPSKELCQVLNLMFRMSLSRIFYFLFQNMFSFPLCTTRKTMQTAFYFLTQQCWLVII